MNKKLMAVAVAGALAAPALALAQASNVQIYGRANLGIDSVSSTGATAGSASDRKSRTRVFDSSSRLGVRGTEDLGRGLKAVFLMESGVNVDNGGTTGQHGGANSSTGTLASREAYVGLAGNWGQVTFGKQNVWWTNLNDQTQANYINVGTPYGTGTFGRLGGPTTRTNDTMKYISPSMGGFTAFVSYAPGSESAGGGADTNASIQGLTLTYRGPVIAQLDVATRKGATGVPARLDNSGTNFSIGWPYAPGAHLSVIFTRLENSGGTAGGIAAASDNLTQNGWQLNWTHMWGNVQGMAQYGRIGQISGCTVGANCNNTGSNAWLVGVKYHLSKRTGIYASYTEVNNESNQYTDYYGGAMGVTAPGTSAAGADPKIFALGIQHNF